MKKIITNSFIAISIAILFSGCFALHSGYMTDSAALGSANFVYVKHGINGMAKATYVFGIGGLNTQALVAEAKQNMMGYYPLKDNQTLTNITLNWKSTHWFLGIVNTTTCTITADVVEFRHELSSVQTYPKAEMPKPATPNNSASEAPKAIAKETGTPQKPEITTPILENLNPNLYKEWKLVKVKNENDAEITMNYDAILQFFVDGTFINTMNYKDGTTKVQKGMFEIKSNGKKIKFMPQGKESYRADVYKLTNTSVEIEGDNYHKYYIAK